MRTMLGIVDTDLLVIILAKLGKGNKSRLREIVYVSFVLPVSKPQNE